MHYPDAKRRIGLPRLDLRAAERDPSFRDRPRPRQAALFDSILGRATRAASPIDGLISGALAFDLYPPFRLLVFTRVNGGH